MVINRVNYWIWTWSLIVITSTSYPFSFSPTELVTSWFTAAEEERMVEEYAVAPRALIEIHGILGDITIKTWHQKKVMVETIKRGPAIACKATQSQVTATPQHVAIINKCEDKHKNTAPISYTIIVPQKSNLRLYTTGKGAIRIKQVQGNIFAQTEDGDITIHDATQSVTAKSVKGSIYLEQKKLNEQGSIFLETNTGHAHLSVRRDIQADIHAKTRSGTVTSEIEITTFGQTVKLNKETWNSWKRDVKGALGKGGAPITIDVIKGNITIKEY